MLTERRRWGAVEGWRLSESPQLVIGEDTDDPRYLLSEVVTPRAAFAYVPGVGSTRGPFRLPGGKIAVGERRSAELRFFDASGRFVHTAIGEGQGPTELGQLSGLHHCVRGTLTAVDRLRDLVVELDGDGELQGRFFLGADAGRDLYLPIACNRSGQILGMDGGESDERLEDKDFVLYRPPVHVWLLDSEGHVILDLGEFPGVERFNYRNPRTGRIVGSPSPLGKRTALALGSDRAFIGTADTFEIQVWSLDGTLQERWRRPTGNSTPRDEDIVSYAGVEPDFARGLQAIRQAFPTFPLPETYPAYTRFLLDATEHLWVEQFRTPREPRHLWSIFAPDGVWLGEVEVPPRFEITDIGDNYVLGVYHGELGEQSVRMYGLLRE